MKKLIPADTVGAAGNVWENIRRGAKETSIDAVKEIVDVLFPVGSIYCGENTFLLSVGTWERLGIDGTVCVASDQETGSSYKVPIMLSQENELSIFTVRFWKRVS